MTTLHRTRRIGAIGALITALAVGSGVACGGDSSNANGDVDGGSSEDGGGGGIDGGGGGEAGRGARSLTSCTTSIDPAAPAFYRTYFKCVTITMSGDSVVIATDALPPHASYYYGDGDPSFAAFDTSRGATYKPNPNKLAKRPFTLTVPAAPVSKNLIINAALVDGVVATSTQEYRLGPVGVALDSVPLFNPLARPGDDIDAEKYTFDAYDAHPAPDGTYHYHQSSRGPLEVLLLAGLTASAVPGTASVELFGIMCDGTVVLGCKELDGTAAPDGASLDAQGGHVGDIKDATTTHFTARYHTHVCPSSATGRKYTPEIQYYMATCAR